MRRYRAKKNQQTTKSAAAKKREGNKRKCKAKKSAENKAASLEIQVAELRAKQWRCGESEAMDMWRK